MDYLQFQNLGEDGQENQLACLLWTHQAAEMDPDFLTEN